MDSNGHKECEDGDQTLLGGPPDINLPLSIEICPDPWGLKPSDLLHTSLAPAQNLELGTVTSSKGRRWVRRGDTIWGAWFFFNHYFRPALNDERQGKLLRDGILAPPLDKSDLRLDLFLVQHDMENMYMWAFKERPENALGKMQLRSYMNGHARFGEPQFPFSADKGFARSHRMQRKHYRGLSNPQCVHGVEVVRAPNLLNVSEDDLKRWMELTGREINFTMPPDAEGFSEWRSLPNTDFDLERTCSPSPSKPPNGYTKKQASARSGRMNEGNHNVNAVSQLPSPASSGSPNSLSPGGKRKKINSFLPVGLLPCGNEADSCVPVVSYAGLENFHTGTEPCWLSSFSGVMTDACGPVTGAKSIYEDDKGYLVMVSLPFIDMQRLRVSWRNTATHGVLKIHCTSTARTPTVVRGDRTFKLTDPNPEHCGPGDFVREIGLATRIPENADLKAFYAEACAGLEIMVPKHNILSEEREVRVFLPPQMSHTEALLL
ncbi:uncharacterized protein [Physcomitrium patens]|uniref:Uncharacterized protein n=1 Tax=Physcomitrium patens TaxID=3218 RepID=A9U0L8_PHYPA|nr:uncharacterized protein LOC112276363 [Physcomitrium patens]XP_024363378.1 uncharacterized protein LOC112276363 [Physcomitrium patens]PNR28453.1 hypothetical protein PHYPA_029045 [Physcomitrium patens]|eukprot:XP_024363376.1 uncharacterized protein LOC112276363 [Physcomitrella patens]